MDITWMTKYITEFIGTAILLILGNGAVANVDLKGTKGNASGWMTIAWGYGMGVMIPALMNGNVSGNHINPAFTLGLAAAGLFPWAHVAQYIIAQCLGALFGQLIVVMVYRPYYLKTTIPNHVLGTFATIDNVDDGTQATRKGAMINGFLNEFAGSFVLFFAALGLTKNFFGAQYVASVENLLAQQGQSLNDLTVDQQIQGGIAALFSGNSGSIAVAHLGLGLLVVALVAALGGPTGPALNPARDLMPRLLHQVLPTSILGEAKSTSKWWYSWVPVVAPILAGLSAVALFKVMYL
jgi:Glycerol uptake facilitator and related permeases (Major Intrinsic Protein Family)